MYSNSNYPLRGHSGDNNHWYSSTYWRSNRNKISNCRPTDPPHHSITEKETGIHSMPSIDSFDNNFDSPMFQTILILWSNPMAIHSNRMWGLILNPIEGRIRDNVSNDWMIPSNRRKVKNDSELQIHLNHRILWWKTSDWLLLMDAIQPIFSVICFVRHVKHSACLH